VIVSWGKAEEEDEMNRRQGKVLLRDEKMAGDGHGQEKWGTARSTCLC
jgi:hypothetical protein